MEKRSDRDFSNVEVLWEPKEDSGKLTKMFMRRIQEKYNIKLNDYWDLHKWSTENLVEFWEEFWHFAGIIHSKPFHQVIDLNVPMSEPQEWFAGAEMNYAENLLRYRDDHVALIVAGEDKETEKVTYAEMYKEAKLYAAGLRKLGLQKGDTVSCCMSNRKEAIFAMLGAVSIGAIWVGALPLMGSQAVLNRFQQVKPKVLFSVDRFPHNREEIDMLPKLKDIADGLPLIEKIIIVASKPESKLKDISGIRNSCFLDDFLQTGKDQDGTVPEMIFEQVSLSHPIFVSYTSGTTGLPKAVVHSSCILLGLSRDLWMCNDCEREDIWLSLSPVGWISWNVFATLHFFGVTVILFEGLPYFLSPTFLWDMADEFGITHMILSPSVLDSIEEKEHVPTERNHLKTLKVIMSGASIVKPPNYDFVYKKIKKDIIFCSVYGCTEIMGSCCIHDQTLRIYRGENTAPSLGVEIQCVDDAGNPLIGETGDLVFSKPSLSLPLGIWGDTDRSLFKKTYFDKYPGKFLVGDLALINPLTKGIVICGRSDETLKPKGCRFGSSEIYNVLQVFPEVLDSLCVAQYNKNMDERAVLFLKMKQGYTFNENLVKRIQVAIEKELSVRHVPQVILPIADIPYNMNGKKMEILVKKIINNMTYNQDAVINPKSLENFKNIPELQHF